MAQVAFADAPYPPADAPAARSAAFPATRRFRFTYAATITGLAPGQSASVWVPVARSTPEQTVRMSPPRVPGSWQLGQDTKYGNAMIYFAVPADSAGNITFSVDYQITRRVADAEPDPIDAASSAMFLEPDRHVPVGGKCMTLLADQRLPAEPTALARVLYDTVDDDLQYRKDKPGWGTGDSDWVCNSRFGNCTDFHSLFISMVRGEHLPAKFEIGFAVPPQHGAGSIPGYHCWAWYLPPHAGWTPVDIALANQHPDLREFYFGHLDENRVAFTTGRDLVLAPPQAGSPLNYFIYPYAEAAGKAVPNERIEHRFSYTDD